MSDFFDFGVGGSEGRTALPPSSTQTNDYEASMPGVKTVEAVPLQTGVATVDTVYFNVGLVALGVFAVYLLMR